MFTPQEINQISFGRATFGGYDMQAVDEFLEPLTEDYITLYKENALLKSKMKVLVTKLEEYRANEASMKDAIVNAQKACDQMVKDAEQKCTEMLSSANSAAEENARNADALIAAENDRVDDARREACAKIDELTRQLESCMKALVRIKEANRPSKEQPAAYDFDQDENAARENDVADEISASLHALVGPSGEEKLTAEPKHPTSETTTGKFANLKFGPDYDPTGSEK